MNWLSRSQQVWGYIIRHRQELAEIAKPVDGPRREESKQLTSEPDPFSQMTFHLLNTPRRGLMAFSAEHEDPPADLTSSENDVVCFITRRITSRQSAVNYRQISICKVGQRSVR